MNNLFLIKTGIVSVLALVAILILWPFAQVPTGTRGVVTVVTKDYIKIRLLDGSEHEIGYLQVKPDPFIKITSDDYLIDFEYLPIRLGWAVSIHSSQGMTLDAMEIDLGKSIFAHGQAYTGLSRARNCKSVKITKLYRGAFAANGDVLKFYSRI